MSFDPQLLAILLQQKQRQKENALVKERTELQRRQSAFDIVSGLDNYKDAEDFLIERGVPAGERRILKAKMEQKAKAKKAEEQGAQIPGNADAISGLLQNVQQGRGDPSSQIRTVNQLAGPTMPSQGGSPELENQLRQQLVLNQLEASGRLPSQLGGLAVEAATPISQEDVLARAKELRAENFANAKELRNAFRNDARVGGFVVQRNAFDRVKASAKDPSPAGDFALIFNFMKVLDPGSTVREGEFANAENAPGVPSAVASMYNRLVGNPEGRLPRPARADFVDRSKVLFREAISQQKALEVEYARLAKEFGVPKSQVVIDFVKRNRPPAAPAPGLEFLHYDEDSGNALFTNPATGEIWEDDGT